MNPEHQIEDEKMARPENNPATMRSRRFDWMKFSWAIQNLTTHDLEEQGLQYSDYQLETFKGLPHLVLQEADESTRLRLWRAVEVRLRRHISHLPRFL